MLYNQLGDEALLALIRRRDEAALSALYDRHAPGVLAVAMRATGERAAAEAVVEQLFWAVWRGEFVPSHHPGRDLRHGARRLAAGQMAAR